VKNLNFITKADMKNFKKLDFKNFIDKQNQVDSKEIGKQAQISAFKHEYLKTQQGIFLKARIYYSIMLKVQSKINKHLDKNYTVQKLRYDSVRYDTMR
jgi:hypothetical protein